MAAADKTTLGIAGVQHVKIPVTDLARSVRWYARLLNLVAFREFVEQGALCGAALRSPEADFVIALRDGELCAGRPNLAGFDLVALRMASRDHLAAFGARCDRLGIERSTFQDRGPDEAVIDVPDPDGIVLRFFWANDTEHTSQFLGLSFDTAGSPAFYDTPRLPV